MSNTPKASEDVRDNEYPALRKRIKDLEKEKRKLTLKIDEQVEFAKSVSAAIVAADPLPAFHYKRAASKEISVVPVLNLSDWHIGERVSEREVEGFNRYNYDIAEKRIYQIVTDFLQWVEINRSVYQIDECAIFSLGDFISGDIHYELQVTNEFPLPVQAAKAGLLFGEVIRIIAPHFKKLHIYEIGSDNHGRLVKKPQAKQKTSNSMNYLVYEVSNAKVAEIPNLSIVRAEGPKLVANVNGWKFLLEHGDGVKGQMGIPYYGFGRVFGKEAVRRMNTDKGFTYWCIGHFHCPAIIENKMFVNGSLSGTSEFDHINGRHAAPSQTAFLVHPKYGYFNFVSFYGK